jgi:ribonuclease D
LHDDEPIELPAAKLARNPVIVDTPTALIAAIAELAAGTGPFGVDAERASGFRYSSRAYLIQIARRGGGTHLIDPIACDDLNELGALLRTDEWILHAATQDLACLAELGLTPVSLFDTELGSRLAGLPRVGLGAVVAELLGLHLAKEHSAADWSTRPLPKEWLEYAALDVELLPDLRDALAARLAAAGKLDIATQEFAHLVDWSPAEPKPDPWRRLSGIQTLSTPRHLAVARELWLARDEFAREIDMGPGRVVPDRALIAAAAAMPTSRGALAEIGAFTGRYSRKELDRWWAAIARGLTTDDLPPMRLRGNGLASPRNWKDKHPEAYARFVCVRASLTELAAQLAIPVENLILPETIRRICYAPPANFSVESIAAWLREVGARNWQVDLIPARLNDCFQRVALDPTTFLAATAEDQDRGGAQRTNEG